MGDAGPPTPLPGRLGEDLIDTEIEGQEREREVTVLVTGFGPFKSFTTNPSWLIASSLPPTLDPRPHEKAGSSTAQSPLAVPLTASPYRIRLVVHPSPVRVSYATASTLVPALLAQHSPDYVVHIGMAGGRDHYTLETIAHREHYKIKDVDERDGWMAGESVWAREGIPQQLDVGWDGDDVLARWRERVAEREKQVGSRTALKPVVKLSWDAGRFLCEFILFESLSCRWKDARAVEQVDTNMDEHSRQLVRDRVGKVAFLHVPGGTEDDDIARGVRVAESAIQALVASWEEGHRAPAKTAKELVSRAFVA